MCEMLLQITISIVGMFALYWLIAANSQVHSTVTMN